MLLLIDHSKTLFASTLEYILATKSVKVYNLWDYILCHSHEVVSLDQRFGN